MEFIKAPFEGKETQVVKDDVDSIIERLTSHIMNPNISEKELESCQRDLLVLSNTHKELGD